MTEKNHSQQHIIDNILGDFAIYLNPKLLKEEFTGKLDTANANKKCIKKYQELFTQLRWAWQKTRKYPQYFNLFYPPKSSGIQNFEALNHHIHSYLEDMTTFKNKIVVLFGAMKNDIKAVASNREDIEEFFKAGIEKTIEGLKDVKKYRDPHVHRGNKFFDGDLLEAENAHGFIELCENPYFDAILNQDYKPKLLAEQKKKKEESFERGKKRWIETATKNDKETYKYLDNILKVIRPPLYQYLKMKSVKSLIEGGNNYAKK